MTSRHSDNLYVRWSSILRNRVAVTRMELKLLTSLKSSHLTLGFLRRLIIELVAYISFTVEDIVDIQVLYSPPLERNLQNSHIIITLSPIYSCSYNDEKTRWRDKHLSAHIATNFGELSKESSAAWSGHVGGLSNNIDSISERIKSSRQQRFSVVHGCSGFMVRWVSTFHFQLHSMSMSIQKLLVKHSMTLFSPPHTQPASLSYSNRSEVWPAVLYSSHWVVNVRWFS